MEQEISSQFQGQTDIKYQIHRGKNHRKLGRILMNIICREKYERLTFVGTYTQGLTKSVI